MHKRRLAHLICARHATAGIDLASLGKKACKMKVRLVPLAKMDTVHFAFFYLNMCFKLFKNHLLVHFRKAKLYRNNKNEKI